MSLRSQLLSAVAYAPLYLAFVGLPFLGGFSGAVAAYQVLHSLRFNAADAPRLSRTFSGAPTDNTKGTFSFWVKRGNLGGSLYRVIFNGYDGSSDNSSYVAFETDDTLGVGWGGAAANLRKTTAVFRDPTAKMHICITMDAGTVVIYVNNVSQTLTGTAGSGAHQFCRATADNRIGGQAYDAAGYNFDGYISDFYWIDGQVKAPSDFAELNATTNQWVPKAYTGTYNNNGFHVDWRDKSGITSSTLGKDYSGNNNDWTPVNLSITAGVGNDVLTDSPTDYGTDTGVGGEVRGNYATFNPLDAVVNFSLANGNLQYTNNHATLNNSSQITIKGPTGFQFYIEFTCTAIGGAGSVLANYVATGATTYSSNGAIAGGSPGATWTTNDTIGAAITSGTGVTWYKNGVSQGTISDTAAGDFFVAGYNGFIGYLNAGQRLFANAAPSGFKALCTQNLPTPTIIKPALHFDINTRAGTSGAGSVSGKLFQPDLVITKSFSARDWGWSDVIRGVGVRLSSNSAAIEATDAQDVTSFNSGGFSFGTAQGPFNFNGENFIDFLAKAGGAGVTNNDGTITGTISANPTAGISIVKWTGTGNNGTIGHGLGVAPKLKIVKGRTVGWHWATWHTGLTDATHFMFLSLTDAQAVQATLWNSTAPTSSVFSLGTNVTVNEVSQTYVAFIFAEVPGFSRIGSYTGNGSADGPFVWCGFRPKWIMIKNRTNIASWIILDSTRSTYNPVDKEFYPYLNNAEATFSRGDFLSNGFKMRNTDGSTNTTNNVYVFAAFAEWPFKYARAR